MAIKQFNRFMCICIIIYILIVSSRTRKKFSNEDIKYYRERAMRMFEHAYNGYLNHAYPFDELRPITCDGHDTWGGYSLTLVDALDTLAVMGNYSEFRRVASLLIQTMDFDRDINVSVFETNIRVVGGLLSGHLLSHRVGMTVEPGWPCSGPLLRMAEDVARRLLPAFNTSTGMPFGTVNLRHGVPSDETTITCTAGVTTFILEFGALSRLTGDPVFERVALRALTAMWNARSQINLVGNHIDVETGRWTAIDSGIGAGIDSYFEYLVKGAIMFQNSQLMEWFNTYVSSIETYLKREDWYLWANMKKGTVSLPVFQSLEAFWPGIQSLVGDIDKAMKTIHNYHQVWRQYGFSPEFYSIANLEVFSNRESYPLRPELIESTMYLYQATKDPYLLEIGIDILEAIEHSAKTPCGYATIRDVRNHQRENRMESFFLAETTKYLFLLFDTDNFIHNTGGKGTVIQTPNGECVIDAGGYIFNTEAHPLDSAAIYCCSAEKKSHDQMMQDFHDNVDLLALLDLVKPKRDVFSSPKKTKHKPKVPPPPKEVPQNRVTINLGKFRKNAQKEAVDSKEEGRVRVALPAPGGHGEFESRIKKLLQDIKLSPATKDGIMDRILNTLNDAVDKADASGERDMNLDVKLDEALSGDRTDTHNDQDPSRGGSGETGQDTNVQGASAQPDQGPNAELSERADQKRDTKDSVGPKPAQTTHRRHRSNLKDDDDMCIPEDRESEEFMEDGGNVVENNANAHLLTCPSQAFYMRLSLMGEMFLPKM